ncbi:uncharacterized protein KQ657_005023 [Scheffersomyces spartinae]|uniref:Uncharacterized protein n=1 Tax=Scheffersomyces spartinae TaxID=45513 RepID=A0A9P8AIE6_9ASCO|nr:uncharacterized protein KQ657_005023 [Scheffersomyces spartinae]KAG7194293.1 hypothetical protein KQ657_005023 [Scheffersomyces spartinae]
MTSNNVPAAKSSSQYIRNIGVHENVMPLIKVQPEHLSKKIDSKTIISTIQKYKKQQAEEELELGRQMAAKKQSSSSSSSSSGHIGNSSAIAAISKGKRRRKSFMSSTSTIAMVNQGYNGTSSEGSPTSIFSTIPCTPSSLIPNTSTTSFSSNSFATCSFNNPGPHPVQMHLIHKLPSDQLINQNVAESPMNHESNHQIPLLSSSSLSGASQNGLNTARAFVQPCTSTERLSSFGDLVSFVPHLANTLVYLPGSINTNNQCNGQSLEQSCNNDLKPSPRLIEKVSNFDIIGDTLLSNSKGVTLISSPHRSESPVDHQNPILNLTNIHWSQNPNQSTLKNSACFQPPHPKFVNGCIRFEKSSAGSHSIMKVDEVSFQDTLQDQTKGEFGYATNASNSNDDKFLDPSKSNLERALDDLYFEYMQVSNGFIYSNYAAVTGTAFGPFSSELSLQSSTNTSHGDINCDDVSKCSL